MSSDNEPDDLTMSPSAREALETIGRETAALGGSFSVCVVGEGFEPFVATVHRPIGMTTLGGDEWVLTEGFGNLRTLLDGRLNPGEKEIADLRERFLHNLAVKSDPPLLIDDGEGNLYYPWETSNMTRNEHLRGAETLRKKSSGGGQRELFHWDAIAYLNPKAKESEILLSNFKRLKENREKALSALPDSLFEPGYGVDSRIKQAPIIVDKATTVADIRLAVIKRLTSMTGSGFMQSRKPKSLEDGLKSAFETGDGGMETTYTDTPPLLGEEEKSTQEQDGTYG